MRGGGLVILSKEELHPSPDSNPYLVILSKEELHRQGVIAGIEGGKLSRVVAVGRVRQGLWSAGAAVSVTIGIPPHVNSAIPHHSTHREFVSYSDYSRYPPPSPSFGDLP